MPTVAIIDVTAAAPGLASSLPGSLQPVLGDPALLWVLRALPGDLAAACIRSQDPQIQAAVSDWQAKGWLSFPVTVQETIAIEGDPSVLLVPGDTPLLQTETLAQLSERWISQREGDGSLRVAACMSWHRLAPILGDGLCTWLETHLRMGACDPVELQGMTSRKAQALLQAAARDRINTHWMNAGVGFLDPASTFVGPRVVLEPDVVLEPGVRLEGQVTVGAGTRIGQGTVITDCLLGRNIEIRPYCVLHGSRVGDAAKLGPFAHLREGSVLEERVHVGNFVETKKATLRAGAKANHLSYVGDAEIGERTNLGAGFISCNYDGFAKHRTVIGKDVFVGSDCQLVAPVTLGDGSTIAAGTTVTEDIPAEALALSRPPLVVKEGGARRLRDKLKAKRDGR